VIPYYPEPSLRLGGLTFYPFGLLAAAALAVGWRLIVWRAPGTGRLTALVLASGFYGSHVVFLLCFARADLSRLLHPLDGIYSFGGIVVGLAVAVWLAPRGRLWQYLDAVAFAFPFAWTVARLGCFLAHDHPGRASTSWIAVRFPSGPRLDLGLIEALFAAGLAACFLLLDRRRRPAPFFTGTLLLLYGPFRVWLDTLHVRPVAADRWFGWAAAAAGAALLIAGRGLGSSSSAPAGYPPGSARSAKTAR
jgi:phosphatidylglycerol:prolipoprotein diacylglycerol transferase